MKYHRRAVNRLFILAAMTAFGDGWAFAEQQTGTSAVDERKARAVAQLLAGEFHWQASGPLLAVDPVNLPGSADHPWVAVKDPSIVRYQRHSLANPTGEQSVYRSSNHLENLSGPWKSESTTESEGTERRTPLGAPGTTDIRRTDWNLMNSAERVDVRRQPRLAGNPPWIGLRPRGASFDVAQA